MPMPLVAGALYRAAARPLLFRLDAEQAHELALTLLSAAGQSARLCRLLARLFHFEDPRLAVDAFGLRFANPLGIAAGFDKNAVAVPALGALGFGHVEVGTVTPRPQPGNPRPRIHRLLEDRALINSMGFPNNGVERFAENLAGAGMSDCVVGANLGKGRETPLEAAAQDYVTLLDRLYDRAAFFVVNVSSPNTVGLRRLQAREFLEDLLRALQARNRELALRRGGRTPRPVLVKVAPDLTWAELDDILAAISAAGASGLVATNTTVSREGLTSPASLRPGGVSGAPLRARATEIVRYVSRQTGGRLPIVGVGGIFTARDALDQIRAGARLVQLYTGFIYEGPTVAWQIKRDLARVLELAGAKSIEEVVGIASDKP